MAKTNQILGYIGGIMMLMSGLIFYSEIQQIQSMLRAYGLTIDDLRQIGFEPNLMYTTMIMTIIWGVIALIGAVMITKEDENGNILLLISGSLAVIGMFIPIGDWTIPGEVSLTFYLSSSLIFVDPFLILLGGIIGKVSDSQADNRGYNSTYYQQKERGYYQAARQKAPRVGTQSPYQVKGTQNSPEARFCPHCGASIKLGARFCTECGKPIG